MSKLTRRSFLCASAGMSAGLLLAACAPAGTAPQAPVAESGAAAPATEKLTVLVWDQFGEDSTGVDQIVAAFNDQNPDIEVKREAQTNMRDILRTALDADAGPDVMYYDTGPGFAGVLARAGLLLELDDAYQQFGWIDRVLPIAKERTTFDGKTYGIGNEVEFIGMFYNQRLFEENGLQEPSDHAGLLEVCSRLKDAGLFPIAFGDQPKWPAGHTFSVFCGNVAGKQKTAQAISAEVPWTDPDFVRAIQIPFVEMREAGFYNPDINAVNYDDANLLFYSGQAAMHLTGTWMIGDYTNPDFMPDPVGFFFYPSVDGKPISPPAGLGSGYFISKKAKNPEAALKFLDFVFSEETVGSWLEGMAMIPPIQFDASQYNISDLLQFTIEQLQQNAGIMSYNIDVLTPDNYNTVMFDGFQEVLGGTRSAEDQAAALEAAMQEAVAAGRVMDITD
jgi:raffinose/stachyose/melibiose transport system substrate-binding protein